MAGVLSGIAAIGNMAISGAQMIKGWADASKGRKQMNSLLANRPQYQISQGYKDYYNTVNKLANQGMPEQGIMAGQIEQSTAKAMTAAERGAMGSGQYMDVINKQQEQEMNAYKNLGIMALQYRTQAEQQRGEAQKMMGGLQDTQWDQNVNQPWNIKANMAGEKMAAGTQSGWQGAQNMASSAMNFAGTNYYQKMLKEMQGQNNKQPQNPWEVPTGTTGIDVNNPIT
jgi:hypothetical protein